MLSDLLDHNERWASARLREDPDYFRRLAAVQRPDYLWIGCSDSRVPANVITGLKPGEVFVHRNIGNLVHRGDVNLLSVLEFAIGTLCVQHIIVCGHHGCGGVRAAMEGGGYGVIDNWLQPVRDVAEAFAAELDGIGDAQARLDRLCELSIAAQVRSLSRMPVVRWAWKSGRRLAIHGWVYGLGDGRLRDLGCGHCHAAGDAAAAPGRNGTGPSEAGTRKTRTPA
ncbi:MAG: carbonic anhydrase [Hyphomicrobiales bacterium]|nr:MAG: carbonic anhydrase [Hyphomicrobiales bacterium]